MNYSIDKIVVGELQTNCYILTDLKSNRCAIVDPGADYQAIKEQINNKKIKPIFIINTHGHPDHVAANAKFNLPVYIHKNDARFLQKPAKCINGGDKIQLEDLFIKIIHTPGHTPGSICLLCSDALFSGDTLFAGGVGRTDLPYGNEKQLFNSIRKKLLMLDDDIKVYPGHGLETTIGKEKQDNPWLQGA